MSKKPIKLNALQKKTLALFQELAKHPESGSFDADSGEATVAFLPRPHGDHVHIGDYVVSARDASGFQNEKVWQALERKGLIRSGYPLQLTLTADGLAYETGLLGALEQSDH
ncbi:hypothetical protein [Emcibacter nanhaiensis]|uniref:Uncharacterized protein n=1 Tax=Emcibacter nanhaiensis TaxID=1505037 RepID=A0A501PN53_9PROT|nr:hypothetical protein [Emcibacter nanhaiensis]TPD61517.1 hypothetical protein FIV46_04730 [Emcibacter nanhaiensis]